MSIILATTGRQLFAGAPSCRAYAAVVGALRDTTLDTPVPLVRVLDDGGLEAALWALYHVLPGQEAARDRLARHFACDVAERLALPPLVEANPGAAWPGEALALARRVADGTATEPERAAGFQRAVGAMNDVHGLVQSAGIAFYTILESRPMAAVTGIVYCATHPRCWLRPEDPAARAVMDAKWEAEGRANQDVMAQVLRHRLAGG
jgi:hypothetical protein